MPHGPVAMQVDRLIWDRTLPPVSFALAQAERVYLCGNGAADLLLALAGFSEPLGGSMFCEGRPLAGVPVPARHVAYIPPGDSLVGRYHLRANVGLPGAGRARATEALRKLGLEQFSSVRPAALRPEHRRLTALARALAADPAVLLVAEGNAPPAIPEALAEIATPPAIVATDDVAVALARADRILLLRDGTVVQLATPLDLYQRPADRFAALWSGPCNLLPAMLDGHGPHPGSVVARVAGRPMLARFRDATTGPVLLAVRPHLLQLAADGVAATLRGIDFLGAATRLRLTLADECPAMLDTAQPPKFSPGEPMAVGWAWTDAWPIPP